METIEKCIEVEAPLRTVYNQWTQFEKFPAFMEGVEQVDQLDEKHLHWIAKIAGTRKEWDAEIVEQVPDERIAWKSTTGAPNSGVVHFRPTDDSRTIVTLRMNYEKRRGMLWGWFPAAWREIWNGLKLSFKISGPKRARGVAGFIAVRSKIRPKPWEQGSRALKRQTTNTTPAVKPAYPEILWMHYPYK
jgi:hypothetical protein